MKNIKKISKIFLVLTMIFSQLSSVVTVLAEEIATKPLNINLKHITNEELGYIEKYEFSYISLDDAYEEEKEYSVELNTSFTYLNGEKEKKELDTVTKTGEELNNTKTKCELEPISYLYNGVFTVEIIVKDGDKVVYNNNISNVVDTVKSGLVGSLNSGEIQPISETLSTISTGQYNVDQKKKYTQSLIIMPGELSPNSNYKVMQDEQEIYKGTGSGLTQLVIEGTTTDTSTLASGTYNTIDTITVHELKEDEEIKNTITYTYKGSINYYDIDKELSDIYNLKFDSGLLYEEAINYNDNEEIIKIKEIVELLENNKLELKIFDEENQELDLTDEEVLEREIKNNYKLEFTKENIGTYTYTGVVLGDNTNDNKFSSEDIKATIKDYLEENKVLSVDTVSKEDEEKGKIDFNDIVDLNNKLNKLNNQTVENTNLSLIFGEVPSEIVVGDSFELKLLVSSSNIDDYINGINAVVATSNNLLKLTNISFNNKLIGDYKDNKLSAVGKNINSNEEVLTFTFTAIEKGTETISLTGEISKDTVDSIEEINKITKDITIIKNTSSNANLKSLKSNIGTFDIAFDKDITVYNLTVPYNTEKVILSGELQDVKSSVTGLYEYTLNEDKTTANIIVTAEDKTTKVYTVYIIKENKPVVTPLTYYKYSSNNYLKLLEISGHDITFDKETLEYNIKVKSTVTSLDIKAIPEDSNSRVEITGNEKFKKGDNVVTITVTAEDGSTREYKINIDKETEKKEILTASEDSSNTAEKIVIIILIILVVLGLLYLIFKKDEEQVAEVELKKEIVPKKENNNIAKKNTTNKNKKK